MFVSNNRLLILSILNSNVCVNCLHNKLLALLSRDCAKLVLNN